MPANKPYIIGLTGGIGCGKTEASNYLAYLGAVVLDADEVSHRITVKDGPALPAIREKFGDEVFYPDGTLDRARLGDIVFGNLQTRRVLEGIMHPIVQRTMLQEMDEAAEGGASVVVFDVPLLFETGMDALCDETWVMYAPEEEQINRVMTRDRITMEQAKARIASQMTADSRNAHATHVIHTDRPIERTHNELQSLYAAVLRKL